MPDFILLFGLAAALSGRQGRRCWGRSRFWILWTLASRAVNIKKMLFYCRPDGSFQESNESRTPSPSGSQIYQWLPFKTYIHNFGISAFPTIDLPQLREQRQHMRHLEISASCVKNKTKNLTNSTSLITVFLIFVGPGWLKCSQQA